MTVVLADHYLRARAQGVRMHPRGIHEESPPPCGEHGTTGGFRGPQGPSPPEDRKGILSHDAHIMRFTHGSVVWMVIFFNGRGTAPGVVPLEYTKAVGGTTHRPRPFFYPRIPRSQQHFLSQGGYHDRKKESGWNGSSIATAARRSSYPWTTGVSDGPITGDHGHETRP